MLGQNRKNKIKGASLLPNFKFYKYSCYDWHVLIVLKKNIITDDTLAYLPVKIL